MNRQTDRHKVRLTRATRNHGAVSHRGSHQSLRGPSILENLLTSNLAPHGAVLPTEAVPPQGPPGSAGPGFPASVPPVPVLIPSSDTT